MKNYGYVLFIVITFLFYFSFLLLLKNQRIANEDRVVKNVQAHLLLMAKSVIFDKT